MKNLDSDDPFELVGVSRPAGMSVDADRKTARCLIEEYALTGFAASEIRDLFASPAYTMPHAIYRRRGARFVLDLVTDVFGAAE